MHRTGEIPQLQFIMVVVIPVISQRQIPMVLVTKEILLLLDKVIDVPVVQVVQLPMWWSRRAENCGFHSCSSCLVVDMPVVAHDRSRRCRRCSSCAGWTSLCSCSGEIQLLVLTAGMWGRLFGVLHTGTGPGAVSTGTRLPKLGAFVQWYRQRHFCYTWSAPPPPPPPPQPPQPSLPQPQPLPLPPPLPPPRFEQVVAFFFVCCPFLNLRSCHNEW